MQFKRGIATFTLDTGKCPSWLFQRMTRLGRYLIEVIVQEFGPEEFIQRLADPVWFQSLGTVLAFDWNASGLTTTLTAALKEAIRGQEKELGVFICGGKGKTSRKTPEEISFWGEKLGLLERQVNRFIYSSRLTAKVDNALLQDGFQIYHHTFFFSRTGAWTVVQQGMNLSSQKARRYHWFSKKIIDPVCEPHSGIVSQGVNRLCLNLVARESEATRALSTQLVQAGFQGLRKDLQILRRHTGPVSRMVAAGSRQEEVVVLELFPVEFHQHPVIEEDFSHSHYLEKILWQLCEMKPASYEQLIMVPGVGPRTVRALSLVSEVIYGAAPSYQDPVRYSFAHGGKDGTPYPVDRITYDQSIAFFRKVVQKMKIPLSEKRMIEEKLR